MKMLTHDLLPCWYELSWKCTDNWRLTPAIGLSVHEDFIKNDGQIPKDAPIVESLKKNFGFIRFEASFDNNFGFDDAFIRACSENNFVKFNILLPKVKKETGKKCKNCKGSGKDEFINGACLHCDGTGKEHECDWKSAYKISASFNIFSMIARFPKTETSAKFPQLLTVETITRAEMHGGSLSGEYSIPLARWLAARGQNTEIPEMAKAMRTAYDHMIGVKRYDEHCFRAYVADNNGWLNVDCPGDACGLNPCHHSSYDMEKGRGYEFSCHNVDTPMQQLTLLAGLAALHERVRKEINCR